MGGGGRKAKRAKRKKRRERKQRQTDRDGERVRGRQENNNSHRSNSYSSKQGRVLCLFSYFSLWEGFWGFLGVSFFCFFWRVSCFFVGFLEGPGGGGGGGARAEHTSNGPRAHHHRRSQRRRPRRQQQRTKKCTQHTAQHVENTINESNKNSKAKRDNVDQRKRERERGCFWGFG